MNYKATYIPPKKNRKLNYKIVVPLVILAILLSYLGYTLLFPKDELQEQGFTVCDLSVYETRELLKNQNSDNNMMMADYFYYGETLNILGEAYNLNHRDIFAGKTIYFKNLCNQNAESTFFLGSTVDNQIYVESLNDGFYSVAIDMDLVRMSLYSSQKLEDTFYTVRRDGKVKRIRIIADQNMANSDIESDILKQNYVFIEVTSIDENDPEVANVYDVIIDPYGNNGDAGSVYPGVDANNLFENVEMYETALEIQKSLESFGLKVKITKNSADEIVDIYGVDGRISNAVKVSGKYYIDLQMNVSADTTAKGGQITYSSYSSNRFATTIYKYLKENTSLPSIEYSTGDNMDGVLASENDGYDLRSIIRESGGYALGAGQVRNQQYDFSNLNSHLAENRHGLQTVSIEYLMISNSSMASLWSSDKVNIANQTSRAILLALGFDI